MTHETLIADLAKFMMRTRLLHADVATDLAAAVIGQRSPLIRAIAKRRCTSECRQWRPDGPNAYSGVCTADNCRDEVLADLLLFLTGRDPDVPSGEAAP